MKSDRRRASDFGALAALGRAPNFAAAAFREAFRGAEPASDGALWARLLKEWTGASIDDDDAVAVGESVLEAHEKLVACVGGAVSLQTALLHELHSRRGLIKEPRIISDADLAALRVNAITDPLTGLYNRRFIDDHFDRELSRAERSGSVVSVVLFDVAGLGAINERLGHPVGDSVLASTAKKIRDSLRVVDAGCRFGGDEFLVLLPNTDLIHGIEVAERIRQRVAKIRLPARVGGTVAMDYGIATFPLDGRTRSFLTKMSDVRLYGARIARRDFPVARRYPRFLVPGLSLKLGSRRRTRATSDVKEIGYGGLSFIYASDKVPPLVEGEILHRFSTEAHPVTLKTVSVLPSTGGRLRVCCAYAS